MNFDLNTAFAVREREDGLLEKDTFDLSTAVPVETPPKEIKQNWELLKDPSFQADWELLKTSAAGQLQDVYTILGAPLKWALGMQVDPLVEFPKVVEQLTLPRNWKPGKEFLEEGVSGDLSILEGLFVAWGGSAAIKSFKGNLEYNQAIDKMISQEKIKTAEEAVFYNITKDLPKYEKIFAEGGKFPEGVDKETKAKVIMEGLNNNPNLKTEVFADTYLRVKGIDPKSIIETTATTEGLGTSNLFNKLKRINEMAGKRGSIILPKIGQKIIFEGRPGTITNVEGQRIELQLLGEKTTAIATLSQLSLPETPKEPVLPTKEAQRETIVEGQEPPVKPPKTAVSGAPEEEPIKINNLNISPEAKVKIEETIESIRPELEKTKGETLTHDEILEAAKTSDILTSATSREATKVFEAKLLRTRQHLAALSEQKGVSAEFIDALKAVRASGTDLARGLGSLRIEATGEEFSLKTKIVNQLTDMGIEVDKIIKAAEGIDFTNQEQVTNFYREFVKPKVWDLINEYRYINLLSSPKTHIVNTFSNLIQVAGLAPGTKLLAGDLPGASAFYKGAWKSVGDAWVKALDAFKGKSFMERPDVAHIPTGSKLLKWGRYIPQALEASDVFFRTIGYEGELSAQLAKGTNLKEAEKIAKEKAAYYVFRKALDPSNKTEQGKLLSAIDSLTTLAYKARSAPIFGRLISWYIPFVQTPMNIAKQMIEFSPAGFSTLPGAKDKRGQLAKALLGSIIFGVAAYLVSKNDTTWSVPTNRKEKDLFFAAGRQPFSIKIGNTWVGYSRLGPLAFPIAIPAAIKNYTQENPNSVTDTNLKKTAKVIGGLGEFFASMSYVEGVGQLMGLVKNAPGAAAKLVTQAPSQLIPLSSLQRWINNFIIDPIYKKTDKDFSAEAILDEARKSIIFATKGLPAYETPEGEKSRRSYPGLNAFSPIPVTKSNREYEEEYKQYIEERKETLIDKKESGDEPTRRSRRRK